MNKVGLLAILDAKPGKEKRGGSFLKSAQPLAEKEEGTTTWFAVHIGSLSGTRFSIRLQMKRAAMRT
jgi:hypothetical protein